MAKQVTWVVIKNDTEIARVQTKKMAEVIVSQVGGMVVKYTKE
jgi:phosphatidylserine decarboxylase